MSLTLSWVVGRGGLLGTTVESALHRSGPVWAPAEQVVWTNLDAASGQLERNAQRFRRAAEDMDWQVVWCAGAAVTASTGPVLDQERRLFSSFLASLDGDRSSGRSPRGSLFLSSSAGALYAAAAQPPFTEQTAVRPVSAYGAHKVELERAARQWADETGNSLLVGRIANVYGAGQDLRKPQGLISQICRAQLLRTPISIYVPLDTVRDYIYAPDCGQLVADALARLREERARGGSPVVVKIIASHRGCTVGAVLGEIRRVLKRSPQVVLGSSPQSALQARDLRLRSTVWPDMDNRPLTPLPVGIHATILHLRRLLAQGSL
jgi:UDP-glucose 4-epimerase